MTLKAKAQQQIRLFPDAFDIERVMSCKSLGEFDDAYIAKIYNYEDKFDYYRQNGSKNFLPFIRVPSIAINALDDPIVGSIGLPSPDDANLSAVRLVYYENGGHCGFICDYDTLFNCVGSRGCLADELANALYSLLIHHNEQNN